MSAPEGEHHAHRTYSVEELYWHALKEGNVAAAEALDRYRKAEDKAWRDKLFSAPDSQDELS